MALTTDRKGVAMQRFPTKVVMRDDRKLYFGDGEDISFDWDNTDGVLTIEGGDIRIDDDQKLYFGDGKDGYILYDESGTYVTDVVVFGGTDFGIPDGKKLYFGSGKDGYIMYDEAGADATDIVVFGGTDFGLNDDKKLYFGAGKDASIAYDEVSDDVFAIADITSGRCFVIGGDIGDGDDGYAKGCLLVDTGSGAAYMNVSGPVHAKWSAVSCG